MQSNTLAAPQESTDLGEKLKQAFSKAKSSLVDFRHIMLVNGDKQCAPAQFHYNWSEALLNHQDHFCIQGFRESAKTQYILRAFPLYALRFPDPSRAYIVIVKNNSDLASEKLKEIESEYLSNPALNFNLKEVKEKSASVFSVDVYDECGGVVNVRLAAYGKGSSIRGLANIDRRPHICIIDDPQDIEDSKSEAITTKDWEWFLSDVMFLGAHTRIFIIGNNLGERCITERVFNHRSELKFQTMRVPVADEIGEPCWPGHDTKESIQEEKENFRKMGKLELWMREKMCISIAEEFRVFQKDDIMHYAYTTALKLREKANVFFTIDPASSTDKSSCFRAIVVNAVNADNYWHLLDIPYGRWDSAQLMDVLFDKVVQWRPMSVGIEKGMYKQVIEPFIQKEMARRNIFFNIVPIEHAKAGSKLERVTMLGPRYKAHTIWHPDEAPWLAELESELAGVTRDGFKSLYVDLIDALAMQEQIAKAPFNSARGRELPRTANVETVVV